MAEIPVCGLCGTRHLAHQAHRFEVGRPSSTPPEAIEAIRGNATRPARDVTGVGVTSQSCATCGGLRKRIAELEDEVATLRATAVTRRRAATDRMRKSRAKRRK